MPDQPLPPGHQIILTNGHDTYILEAEGHPTRPRHEAVADAWAAHRRRLVEQHLRRAAPEPAYAKPENWPPEIMAEYRRHLALRTGDPITSYRHHYPEDAEALDQALATGDTTRLRNVAHPTWQDDTYTYELRPEPPLAAELRDVVEVGGRYLQSAGSTAIRRRRADRLFRFEFTGTLNTGLSVDVERDENRWLIDPDVTIGGRDIVTELEDDDGHTVRVNLNGDYVATGKLTVSSGSRGLDETEPNEEDTLRVANANVLWLLNRLDDGANVTLTIEQTDPEAR